MDDRRRGLKLNEVMVIIGIFGLLLGLIVPVMRYGHDQGRRAQCQNNIRNISLALYNFSTTKFAP